MNFRVFLKIGVLFALWILLMLPMAQIGSLIRERQALRDEVVADVARSAGHAQTLTGPVIIVPYSRTVLAWEETTDGKRKQVSKTFEGRFHFLPEDFEASASLSTQERSRGIYGARVVTALTALQAKFELPADYGVNALLRQEYSFGRPWVAIGVSDIRGIGNGLTLDVAGQKINFEPGTRSPVVGEGVHAPLPESVQGQAQALTFQIGLQVQGVGPFQLVPVGRESRVTMNSDWPHPSFIGRFVPNGKPEISEKGFSARWQTSFFATNLQEALQSCARANGADEGCTAFRDSSFGVSLVVPVDHYLKSERAAKYAFLFIGITFAAFFLFEVLRRFSVHPVQYALVGLSLAMFFLLLIALAEHLGFTLAYVIAAAACVLLNAYYVRHALGSIASGMAFGAALAFVYGLLFGILRSEDYALLMGALLVFGLLAAAMVLTRRVKWDGVGSNGTAG